MAYRHATGAVFFPGRITPGEFVSAGAEEVSVSSNSDSTVVFDKEALRHETEKTWNLTILTYPQKLCLESTKKPSPENFPSLFSQADPA
jgi:hypothetical protein